MQETRGGGRDYWLPTKSNQCDLGPQFLSEGNNNNTVNQIRKSALDYSHNIAFQPTYSVLRITLHLQVWLSSAIK